MPRPRAKNCQHSSDYQLIVDRSDGGKDLLCPWCLDKVGGGGYVTIIGPGPGGSS